MNKTELIEAISQKVGVSKKESEAMLEALLDIVISSLQQGKEVTLTGFGTFLTRKRSARKGVNPQNPSQIIDVPEVTVAKFKTGKALKDALKKPKAAMAPAPAPAAPQTPAPQGPTTM